MYKHFVFTCKKTKCSYLRTNYLYKYAANKQCIFCYDKGAVVYKKGRLADKVSARGICKALNAQGNNELTAKKLQMADKIKK